MSTVARLLEQKQLLLELLQSDPGPNEREELEQRLVKVETALTWLETSGPADQKD